MGYKKVCLSCRKAFSQGTDFTFKSGMKCPECENELIEVNHKFRPPSKKDIKEWNVVKYLIKKGFLYQHVTEKGLDKGNLKYIDYPTTMKEAKVFVEIYKDQAIKKGKI